MVPADPSSADGAARRQTDRHQDRREPRPRARPMPPHHPQARHQADRVGRYRRQRAHRRRTRRQELRLDCLAARGGNLRPRHPGRGRRGRDPQHHALCGAGARGEMGRTGIGAAGHHFCVPGAQPARRALQGDGRLCHQRRQHDQARKLHGRRQFLRHAILCRRRRPSRGQESGLCAGGAEILLARIPHRRRLSRPSVPRDVQREAESSYAVIPASRNCVPGICRRSRLAYAASRTTMAVTPPPSSQARTRPPAGCRTSCARRDRRPR